MVVSPLSPPASDTSVLPAFETCPILPIRFSPFEKTYGKIKKTSSYLWINSEIAIAPELFSVALVYTRAYKVEKIFCQVSLRARCLL